jgi:hypothetical protein
MTAEHQQSPCGVKKPVSKPVLHDEESSFLLGNPEKIIEALQLWKRVGHKKFTDLLQAILDHREKSATEIVEDVGVGGKLPKQRGLLRKPAMEAFDEFIKQGFADAPLNDTQRLVAFRRVYRCTHAEIGQELGMSAATSSSIMSRAKAIVREMDAANGVVRDQ